MKSKNIGVHETLELHELLTFKSLCLTKSTAMQPLAKDPTLKALFQQDVQMTTAQITDLHSLTSNIELH